MEVVIKVSDIKKKTNPLHALDRFSIHFYLTSQQLTSHGMSICLFVFFCSLVLLFRSSSVYLCNYLVGI